MKQCIYHGGAASRVGFSVAAAGGGGDSINISGGGGIGSSSGFSNCPPPNQPGGADDHHPFGFFDFINAVNFEQPLYRGPSIITVGNFTPDVSTEPNKGMATGAEIAPYPVHEDSVINNATLSISEAAIRNLGPLIYPCYVAVGLFRSNYAVNVPQAGDLARTYLGTLYFSVPNPALTAPGTSIGVSLNLGMPLLDGNGLTGRYPNTLDAGINVDRGWLLGASLLAPLDDGFGDAQSNITDVPLIFPWDPLGDGTKVDMNSAIEAVGNIQVQVEFERR